MAMTQDQGSSHRQRTPNPALRRAASAYADVLIQDYGSDSPRAALAWASEHINDLARDDTAALMEVVKEAAHREESDGQEAELFANYLYSLIWSVKLLHDLERLGGTWNLVDVFAQAINVLDARRQNGSAQHA